MHLLNKRRHRYIWIYVSVTLEHGFHNQMPLEKKTSFLLKKNPIRLNLLDLTNGINIFVFHHVSMEYQSIYKSIINSIHSHKKEKIFFFLTGLFRSSIFSRFNRTITFLQKENSQFCFERMFFEERRTYCPPT